MIAFLGAGNIATALAFLLAKRANQVRLYSIEQEVTDSINQQHVNIKYLPEIVLPENVTATAKIEEALERAKFVFIAVPSHAVADVLLAARPFLAPDVIIVSITKGIDPETFHPLILQQMELLPESIQKRLVILGGPAVANELAAGHVAGLVAASKDSSAAEAVRDTLSHSRVRISLSSDLIGVGLCSALKNAYAIALGMCDGLKLSTNVKALIFTQALQEMAQLVEAVGGNKLTTFELAGVGDLFVTGNSPHGRNRSYGELLVTASSKDPKELGLTTVEGIAAASAAYSLAKKHQLNLPLLNVICTCLGEMKDFAKPFKTYLHGRT